ncbi:MAG: hypothetical protein Edafosvirus1_90 [Edafosvirus sp.]|uniref:Methyltransferase domain-containing protein n=1 Tax=Edafosvirus sp. TaxID=2487765 RepID=A0A3G4ZWF0_9VIRU|nr:MAG: hypothetical protein Edafosvirus1_90 [Edafosvirus sp.]
MAHTEKKSLGYADIAYLDTVGKQLQHLKQRSIEKMCLKPGDHVLDLGCGPASDTISLAQVVGKTGKVVGIDCDNEMIKLANQRAIDANVNDFVTHQVHMIHGSTKLPFEDNTFDACRSERVFQHLVDPKNALLELVRVTKPGGKIIIMDTDWGSIGHYTSFPEIESKIKLVYRDKISLNPLIARQIHSMMREANLKQIKAEPVIFASHDYKEFNYILGFHNKVKDEGMKCNYFTQEEYDKFVNDLIEINAKGDFLGYVCGFITIGEKI